MRFAVIDTETSGLLDDPYARVVEVGVALFDTGDVDTGDVGMAGGGGVEGVGVADPTNRASTTDPTNRALVKTCAPYRVWSSLVRPDILTAEGRKVIEKVSGIDPEEVLRAPFPAVVLEELVTVIGDLGVRTYNWAFDHPMMVRSFGSFPWSGTPIAWGEDAVTGESTAWREAPACIMEAFIVRYRPFTKMHEDGRPMFVRLVAAARLLGLFDEGASGASGASGTSGATGVGALHRAAFDAALAGRIAVALDLGARAVDVQVDTLTVGDLIGIDQARRGESEIEAIGVLFDAAPRWPDEPDVEV